jgi:hypothetical protein
MLRLETPLGLQVGTGSLLKNLMFVGCPTLKGNKFGRRIKS